MLMPYRISARPLSSSSISIKEPIGHKVIFLILYIMGPIASYAAGLYSIFHYMNSENYGAICIIFFLLYAVMMFWDILARLNDEVFPIFLTRYRQRNLVLFAAWAPSTAIVLLSYVVIRELVELTTKTFERIFRRFI